MLQTFSFRQMTKFKPRLTLPRKRRRVRFKPCPGIIHSRTPLKSPAIKSPFRSPLYKASPARKKLKLSRNLFKSLETNNDSFVSDLIPFAECSLTEHDENVVPKKIQSGDNCTSSEDIREPEQAETLEYFMKLTPDVMSKLSNYGLDYVMLLFFQQIANEEFPVENISF